MQIVGIRKLQERARVYDIEVEDGHHYILDNGVISHNSGGGGFRYACSTIITMTKAQDKDGDEIRGAIVTCTAYKSRLTREKLKVKTRILHRGGLDRYYGLVPLAEAAGLLRKNSTRFEWTDTGEKCFESVINRDPKKYWTKERLDVVEKYVNGHFLYVSDTDIDELPVEIVADE